MIRKVILFVAGLAATSNVHAQNAEVQFSSDFGKQLPVYCGVEKADMTSYWFFYQENGLVPSLEKLDSTGHQVWVHPITNIPGVAGESDVVQILYAKHQLIILLEANEKKEKRKTFYVYRFSTDGIPLSGALKLFAGDINAKRVGFTASPNEESFLLLIKGGNENNISEISCVFVQLETNAVSERALSVPDEGEIECAVITNFQKVVLAFRYSKLEKPVLGMCSFGLSEKDFRALPLNLGSNRVQNLTLAVDHEGRIFATGFYLDANDQYKKAVFASALKPRPYTGIYRATLNESVTAFSSVITSALPAGIEKIPAESYSVQYTRLECHVKKDGGYMIVEEKNIRAHANYNTYCDILIVDVAPACEVNYMRVVSRKQRFYDTPDWPASFQSWYDDTNGNLFILSNMDSRDIENLTAPSHPPFDIKYCVPSLFTLDSMGEMAQTKIALPNPEIVLLPAYSGTPFKGKSGPVPVLGLDTKSGLVRAGVLTVK